MAQPRSISSNCTSLSYAPEQEGIAPSALSWKLLDPESYTDSFGSSPEFTTATTIGSGRAPQKGKPVGKTVSGAFATYMRQYEIQPFLPGFFINHPIETANTNTLDRRNQSPSTVTAVSANGYTGTNFTSANGWDDRDDALLIHAEGFNEEANNGLKTLSSVTSGTEIAVSGTVAETSAPAGSFLEVCGYISTDTIPAMTVSGSTITLASGALKSGGSLEQPVGAFIYIGGDTSTSRYSSYIASPNPQTPATNGGWARISQVTSTGVVCDLTTFTPVADTATGLNTLQVYVPTRIFKDSIDCDISKIRTYAFERRLGKGDDTYPHEQCQLITGSFANQLDLAMPSKTDIKSTMRFLSRESYRRDGSSADQSPYSGANREKLDTSELFNTTTDIKHALLYRHEGAGSSRRASIFGLITDGTFSLNNNAKPIEGWGVFGAWDINPGNLLVNTSVTALFTSIEPINLAEGGVDAGFFVIMARKGSGYILDVPNVTVQSSALTVENNEPIMIDITNEGNESKNGYAASMQFFDRLPLVATRPRFTI